MLLNSEWKVLSLVLSNWLTQYIVNTVNINMVVRDTKLSLGGETQNNTVPEWLKTHTVFSGSGDDDRLYLAHPPLGYCPAILNVLAFKTISESPSGKWSLPLPPRISASPASASPVAWQLQEMRRRQGSASRKWSEWTKLSKGGGCEPDALKNRSCWVQHSCRVTRWITKEILTAWESTIGTWMFSL